MIPSFRMLWYRYLEICLCGGEDRPLKMQKNKATSAVARRSPHIVSHDLHEVEEHTEKDVIPR